MKKVLFLVAVLGACGGKNKNDTESGGTIDTQATTGDPTDRSGEMVPAETMDEINRLLGRKQMIISRCLSSAVESGDAPKGARAKITLAIAISPSGQAEKVEVVKTTLDAETVKDCVVKHVRDIGFPQVPKLYETSYTYAMEAN